MQPRLPVDKVVSDDSRHYLCLRRWQVERCGGTGGCRWLPDTKPSDYLPAAV